MQTFALDRVFSTFRGSTWPVLAASSQGKLVVKLRGSAEGLLPLIAEVIVGALADALALLTPERYLVELPAGVPCDDPHEELRDLLDRSAGLNLGFRFLDGFRNVTVADAGRIKPELAARIVWLDALVQNPDRTQKNPNLMIKAGQIWLIDHGAALNFHHDWRGVTEQAPRERGRVIDEHLLQVSAEQLAQADAELAPKIGEDTLERAVAAVPEAFLTALGGENPARQRAAYAAYLRKRLRAPRPFVGSGKRAPFQFER
jgi:HipA-like protein